MGSFIDYSWCRRTIPISEEWKVNADPTGFEDAWADIYWAFAHDDMAFDYRDRYYKERFLKVKAGLVDFEKLTIVKD